MQYQISQPHVPQPSTTVVAQRYEFPVNQPELRAYAVMANIERYQTGPQVQLHQGATRQQSYIFFPNEPEMTRFISLHQNRHIVLTKFQVDQGATVQRTDPIPPNNQPLFNYYKPDTNWYLREGPAQQFEGAIRQQTYLFPPNQPELNRQNFLQFNRFIIDAVKRFEGATLQQTYLFPTPEPEFRYYLRNTFAQSFRPVEGATSQQTFVFPPNEPEFRYYLRNTFGVTFTPILGATVQQIYLFNASQPDVHYYYPQPQNGKVTQPLENTVVPVVIYIPGSVSQPQNVMIQYMRYNSGTYTP